MERSMGLEPTPGPWQGPVLPLYYDRPINKTLARRGFCDKILAAQGCESLAHTPVEPGIDGLPGAV